MSFVSWGRALELGESSSAAYPTATRLPQDALSGAPVAVAAGTQHSLVLTDDGAVFSSGAAPQLGRAVGAGGQSAASSLARVAGALAGEHVTAIAAGALHSAALTAGGALYEWGALFHDDSRRRAGGGGGGGNGQQALAGMDRLGRNEYLRRIVQRSEAAYLANRRIEEITTEGVGGTAPREGGGGGGGGAAAPADGDSLDAAEILRAHVDRVLVTSPRRAALPPGVLVRAVACGYAHSVLVDAAGRLWSAGYCDRGQLGTGDRRASASYVRVRLAAPVARVAAGQQHSLAAALDGDVYSWGSGVLGQLGHGGSGDRLLPTRIAALAGRRVLDVAAGANHSLVADADGALFAFGHSEYGQMAGVVAGGGGGGDDGGGGGERGGERGGDLGASSRYFYTPRRVVALARRAVTRIAAGGNFSLALLQSGELVSFGWNAYWCLGRGQGERFLPEFGLVRGLGGAGIASFAAGYHHALAATRASGDPHAAGLLPALTRLAENAGVALFSAAGGRAVRAGAAVGPAGLAPAELAELAERRRAAAGAGGEAAGVLASAAAARLRARRGSAELLPPPVVAAGAGAADAAPLPSAAVPASDDAASPLPAAAAASDEWDAAEEVLSAADFPPPDVLLLSTPLPAAAAAAAPLAAAGEAGLAASRQPPPPVLASTAATTAAAAAAATQHGSAFATAREQLRELLLQQVLPGAQARAAAPAASPAAAAAPQHDASGIHAHAAVLALVCPLLGAAMLAARAAPGVAVPVATAAVSAVGREPPLSLLVIFAAPAAAAAGSSSSGSSVRWTIACAGVPPAVLAAAAAFLYGDRLLPLAAHRLPALARLADALALPRLAALCAAQLGAAQERLDLIAPAASAPPRDATFAASAIRLGGGGGDADAAAAASGALDGDGSGDGSGDDARLRSTWASAMRAGCAAPLGDCAATPPPSPFADVVLRVHAPAGPAALVAAVDFAAHRAILCARSAFFRGLLLREGFAALPRAAAAAAATASAASAAGASAAGGGGASLPPPPPPRELAVATLEDVEPETLAAVLDALYTGDVAALAARPERLLATLALAARLCLTALSRRLQGVLIERVSREDVPLLLDFAEAHAMPRLARTAAALLRASPTPTAAAAVTAATAATALPQAEPSSAVAE